MGLDLSGLEGVADYFLICSGSSEPQVKAIAEAEAEGEFVIAATLARWAHERYDISGVPMLLVADHEGVVRRAFVGPQSATDIWAAVASARDPEGGIESGLGALP